MDAHDLGNGIFFVVGAIALISFVLIYQNTTGLMVGEQPSNNHPPFLLQSGYLANYNLCNQYKCVAPGTATYGFAEQEGPAQQIGNDGLTGNLLCACPDGKVFQARPDRIEVNIY